MTFEAKTATRSRIWMATLCALLGCAQVPVAVPEDEPVEVTEQAVINGSPGATASLLKLLFKDKFICSALLVRNNKAVTAKHCLVDSNGNLRSASDYKAVNYANTSRSISTLVPHPSLDVAVVWLTMPLPMANRNVGAFQEFYPLGNNTLLAGATHNCMGWGYNTCARTGDGVSRYATLPIRSTTVNSIRYSENAAEQTMFHGDSGGSCFFTFNGRSVWSGTTSDGPVDCQDDMFTDIVAGPDVRGWLQDKIDPSVARTDPFTAASIISSSCGVDTGFYEVCNPPSTSGGPAAWTINTGTGVLEESSNVSASGTSGIERDGTHLIWSRDAMGDGTVEVRAWSTSSDDDAAGLVLRMRDGTHYYRFSVDRERNYARIVRRSGSSWLTIAETTFTPNWTSPGHKLAFSAGGNWLLGYVDGTLVVGAIDPDQYYNDGRYGIYDYALKDARFDDFKVTPF